MPIALNGPPAFGFESMHCRYFKRGYSYKRINNYKLATYLPIAGNIFTFLDLYFSRKKHCDYSLTGKMRLAMGCIPLIPCVVLPILDAIGSILMRTGHPLYLFELSEAPEAPQPKPRVVEDLDEEEIMLWDIVEIMPSDSDTS